MSLDQSRTVTEQFEYELIRRANRGDADAGMEILRNIVLRIDHKDYNSPLFPYLAECLWSYLHDGIQLDCALNVEAENKGGRPGYDWTELAAVDVLLRFYKGDPAGKAIDWIECNIGASKDTVSRMRAVYRLKHADAPFRRMDRETLLHFSGTFRQKVAKVLPQT
jgi:hypothetical protein